MREAIQPQLTLRGFVGRLLLGIALAVAITGIVVLIEWIA